MIARIHRPSRGATQSGYARTKAWLLEYERSEPRQLDPLMGWTGSSETSAQIRIAFDTMEEAVAFAQSLGIDYKAEEPTPDRQRKGLSYSDNFKSSRVGAWTH